MFQILSQVLIQILHIKFQFQIDFQTNLIFLKSIISCPLLNNSAREPHTLRNQFNNKSAPSGVFLLLKFLWSVVCNLVQNLYIRTSNHEVRITTNLRADTTCHAKPIPRNQSFKICPPGQVFFCFLIIPASSKGKIKKSGNFSPLSNHFSNILFYK